MFIRLISKKTTTVLWPFIAYVIMSWILHSGGIFYEDGAYKDYLLSMLNDYDFNIINQVSSHKSWLVTSRYFHPDFHYEIYSALLFIPYLLEFGIFNLFNSHPNPDFTFTLSALTLNFFSLYYGLHFTKEAAKQIGIEITNSHFYLFFFGTVLFFFSVFYTTVPEVLAFPSMAYMLLIFFKTKREEKLSYFYIGINLAFLLTQKSTMWLFPIYVVGRLLCLRWKNFNWRELVFLLSPVFILLSCKYINIYLKYGPIFDPTAVILKHYVDNSYWNIFLKLFKKFVPYKGTYFVSPFLFVCLFSSAKLLAKLVKDSVIKNSEIIIFVIWFLLGESMHAIVIGDLGENHIPGRLILSSSPFFIVALAYLFKISKHKKFLYGLSIALTLWSVVMTYGYVAIDTINPYLYSDMSFPTGEYFTTSFQNYKWSLRTNIQFLAWFSLPISLYLFSACAVGKAFQKVSREKIWQLFITCSSLVFIGMTILNISNYQKNIDQMKAIGFFDNKVIGNGPEIYVVDYIFDYFKSLRMQNDPELNAILDQRTKALYEAMKPQVIQSNPEFDEAVRTNSPDFSYWIRDEYKEN